MPALTPPPFPIQFVLTDDDRAHLAGRKHDPYVIARVLVERAVVRRAVHDLLAAGHLLRVNYGDQWAQPEPTDDMGAIMASIQACDEEELCVYKGVTAEGKPKRIGTVLLVYGNDGWDVIADNSGSIRQVLVQADELADFLSEVFPAPGMTERMLPADSQR